MRKRTEETATERHMKREKTASNQTERRSRNPDQTPPEWTVKPASNQTERRPKEPRPNAIRRNRTEDCRVKKTEGENKRIEADRRDTRHIAATYRSGA